MLPDSLRHDLVAFDRGVDTVGEVKLSIPRDPFQQKWNKLYIFLSCQIWKNCLEILAIGIAHIRRDLHACKQNLGVWKFILKQMIQSRRLRPLAVVSPLRPPLMTW